MNRKGFVGRVLAALGVLVAGSGVRNGAVGQSRSPTPPCPVCGGSGEVILEKRVSATVSMSYRGRFSYLPEPDGPVYESHSCPECSIYGKSVIEMENLNEKQRDKNRLLTAKMDRYRR